MELVKKLVSYTSKKDGQEKTGYNFYLQDENGVFVAIKNSFPNDYALLKYLAKDITTNGEEK